MNYLEAVAMTEDIRSRFDSPFSESDKASIASLYKEVMLKEFKPTTCQQCYHDALIEISLKLKKTKKMPTKCKYSLLAGFIISCPDFKGGKIFTNDNLTDKVAEEYLKKYPKMREYFATSPDDDKGGDGGKE